MVTVSIVSYPPESANEIGKRYFELNDGICRVNRTGAGPNGDLQGLG